ncbi:MAG: DUF1304 domain-containing protein [Myxococcales bacterium]|nr:DUF1304 domain-containing protein [Myxococcales bacterium]
MSTGAAVVFGLVAFIHGYFFVLESVLWGKPRTNKIFGVDAETAAKNAGFAKNQGVYNLFLVAGLVWALGHPEPSAATQLATFFGGCVVVAGVFGALTVNKRIFFVQALPALIGLGLLHLASRTTLARGWPGVWLPWQLTAN